ncbi:MAG: serine hydrolase domain-containing protein [Pyrinomonadaceae bacterium]
MKINTILFLAILLVFQIHPFGRVSVSSARDLTASRAGSNKTGGYDHQWREKDLSALLEKGLRHGFPGFILGIDQKGRKPVISAKGLSSIEKQIPIRSDDRFHIASITKIFTAVAVLRLIDQEKLSLNTKVTDVLDQKLISPIPYIDQITISQLLDHSSGIYGFNNDKEYVRTWLGEGVKERVRWTPKKLISLSYGARVEPFGKPGTGHYYGDTNYVLLGLVIEKISGKSLRRFVADEIFEPLEMHDTAYLGEKADPLEFELPATVEGYLRRSEELDSVVTLDPGFKNIGEGLVNTTSAAERIDAASGIVSTARDLLTFGRAFYDGRLLSERSMRWFFSAGSGIENDPIGTVRQSVAAIHRRKYGVVYASTGDGPGGINATLVYHPKSQTLVVAFTNIFGLFDEIDFMNEAIISEMISKEF